MRGNAVGGGDAARVVVLSGSPAPGSRTWGLAVAVGEHLAERELEVELVDLRALPPAELLHGASETGAVCAALEAVARANGVVLITPIHHASYSGLLKSFIDLLPRGGLGGKVALPLAVGGSPAHVLAIEYALRPVLVSLGAAHIPRGHLLLSDELERAGGGLAQLKPAAEQRLQGVLREFAVGIRLHARDESAAGSPRFLSPLPPLSAPERPMEVHQQAKPVA